MINLNRVFAMVYRYYINMRHNFDRLTDMFYWPAMDLFIWGLTGLYFAQTSNNPDTIVMILTGLIFWIVIWRAQYEITTNLLAEMWDQNLINIFASPLKVSEWIAAVVVFGLGKMVVSIVFSAILALLLYNYPIFLYGVFTIPIIFSLVLTGWAVGFFVAGFIIRYGQKVQTTAWMGAYLLAPFSALYYPIHILPQWAQKIALFVPSSYIFEGMREVLSGQTFPLDKLLISFALNAVYLLLSIMFFMNMFEQSKQKGLGRLT